MEIKEIVVAVSSNEEAQLILDFLLSGDCHSVEKEREDDADPKPVRRRNRSTSKQKPEASESPDEGVDTGTGKPHRRRRNSKKTGDAIEGAEDNVEASDKPEPAKRRRKSKATENVDADEISDADLSKAASQGASEITPKGVMEILEQFGVEKVEQLEGGQRREFLDLVNEAIEAG